MKKPGYCILVPWWLLLSAMLTACTADLDRGASDREMGAAEDWPGTVAGVLGETSGDEGFARAVDPRSFRFPRDHGAHPEFRNEWWYFTGNLTAPGGRRFGYQLTFFRIALAPGDGESDAGMVAAADAARHSDWRTRQLYMAHFALSDGANGTHQAYERFGRGAVGIAGAQNPPLHLWLDHWEARAQDPSGFPLRLHAADGDVAVDLVLTVDKPVVLNGEAGLSRKSAAAGNASYYYSMPRLASVGEVRIGDEVFDVTGASWLDREWSTSALAPNQAGWDWFALQLDDGLDLMMYRMRLEDGSMDTASAGSLVAADGESIHLDADDMVFEVMDHWTSPQSGVSYPLSWRLGVPDEELSLVVKPLFPAQEMNLILRYWEGAVDVIGTYRGRRVGGKGYMELAGYGDRESERAAGER